ncbi:heme/hemin ABC transporter substrate-binding protein [Photobacterium galatheae]|nr:ABC transporter substrate-binding protein [Photobacterium galatheae]MCM0149641.1 ABC transporter substrate-binding protein [Photobacterium galatheae]
MRRAALSAVFLLTAATAWAGDRIISAGSGITELINALGAEDQLVAVDITSKTYVNDDIPKLGYHRQLSAESIISLAPDHLMGSEEMGPESTLSLLRQAGIQVDILNSGETIADLMQRIHQVGQLTGKTHKAEALAADVQDRVSKIEQRVANQKNRKRVLFLTIHGGRAPMVGGSKTTADTLIQLAGATNPAAQQVEAYKPLSTEAMIDMQPDVILLSTHTSQAIGGIDGLLKTMPLLAATPAGQNKAIITVDGTALIGGLNLKTLEEAERLNQKLYGH